MATLEAFQDGCWCPGLFQRCLPRLLECRHVTLRGKERVFHLGGVSSHALSGCLPHSRHPSLLSDFLEERQTTAKCACIVLVSCMSEHLLGPDFEARRVVGSPDINRLRHLRLSSSVAFAWGEMVLHGLRDDFEVGCPMVSIINSTCCWWQIIGISDSATDRQPPPIDSLITDHHNVYHRH